MHQPHVRTGQPIRDLVRMVGCRTNVRPRNARNGLRAEAGSFERQYCSTDWWLAGDGKGGGKAGAQAIEEIPVS